MKLVINGFIEKLNSHCLAFKNANEDIKIQLIIILKNMKTNILNKNFIDNIEAINIKNDKLNSAININLSILENILS